MISVRKKTSVILLPPVNIFPQVHLFDIDVPGKIRFKESETLTGGSQISTFDVPIEDKEDNSNNNDQSSPTFARLGLGICYDVRFPEYWLLLREKGCHGMCIPGAFNLTTGPKHWHLLMKARAVDTQSFVLACAPARSGPEVGGYKSFGHSFIVDPWGAVLSETAENEDIVREFSNMIICILLTETLN
jgi:omega-amidase